MNQKTISAVLCTLATILVAGCSHHIISKDEAKQATATLKEVTQKVQEYHAKNGQWPADNDFAALGMKKSTIQKWDYSFTCSQANASCEIVTKRGKDAVDEIVMRLQYLKAEQAYSQQIVNRYTRKKK